MADITTIILTYNEEKNIEKCINSIKSISKKVIVVDSYSTDKTIEICKSLDVEVVCNEFVNQAQQFNWAIDNLEIDTKWIMRIDADEQLNKEASLEIENILASNNETDVNGLILQFEVLFLGRKIKHGGVYPKKDLRVFRKGFFKMEQKNMDERAYLLSGKALTVKSICIHNDYKDLTAWIDKHNKYSSREVLDYVELKNTENNYSYLTRQAKIKRFLKNKIYYKLSMFFRAKLYYFYRYYVRLGFLDGKEGKFFCFLQAYWYRVLVDAKIYEYKMNSESKKGD